MAELPQTARPASIDAVKVSPSSFQPPVVEAQKPTGQPAPESNKPDAAAQLEARAKEIDRAHARLSKERRELAAKQNELKAAQAKLAEFDRIQADRRRNPEKYLKAELGDDWYDKATRLKTEGVPPADLVASELEATRAEYDKKLKEQEERYEKRFTDLQTQENERAKAKYLSDSVAYAKANPEKYRLLNHFKEFDSIPHHIEAHFRGTTKQDADGNWQAGETLSFEAAAEAVEKQLSDIAEKFRGYFAEEAKAKGAKPEGTDNRRLETTPRREGNTPSGEWTPPKDDRERWARALAAGDRHMAARTTQH